MTNRHSSDEAVGGGILAARDKLVRSEPNIAESYADFLRSYKRFREVEAGYRTARSQTKPRRKRVAATFKAL